MTNGPVSPPLGFVVDTSQLERAQLSAKQLAAALRGLAGEHDHQAEAARRALAAQRAEALAMQKAAEAAARKERAQRALHQTMTQASGVFQTVSHHVNGLSMQFSGAAAALTSPTGLTAGLTGLTSRLAMLLPSLGGILGLVGTLTAGIGLLAGAMLGLQAVTVRAQEQFVLLEARLNNVYGSTQAASEAMENLFRLARENGVAMEQAADAYLRLARNNEAIGLTRREMADLTDAVQKLGRISNASSGELASGLLQFSQALAAGRLNGDELRSIMENMPALTKAIADGLGVSVGQMRALGAEGQLTSDKIVRALLGQLPKIREEFENLPETTDVAFTRVSNAWNRLLGNMGEALDSSGVLTKLAAGAEAVLNYAADAIAPETDSERLRYLERLKAIVDRLDRGEGDTLDRLFGYSYRREWENGGYEEWVRLIGEREAARMLAGRDEQRVSQRAPFVRSQGSVQKLDDIATKTKKLREEIALYEDVIKRAEDTPGFFEKEELERIKKYPEYVAALRTQLANTLPVLVEYHLTTQRMADDRVRFGAGGAASIGDEARKIVNSAAKAGQAVSFDTAVLAVMRRRAEQVSGQTAGMDVQIATQQRLIEAIGRGARAQREAEIANKRLEMQLRQFGTQVTPEAEKALDDYTRKLRELMEIQSRLASEQRAYNAELELTNQRQINAAIAAGASPGEIAALRRAQQLDAGLRDVGAIPSAGADSVTLAGGRTIPANLRAYFDAASRQTGIPVPLLAAVARVESDFNMGAVSPTGARGIMQILPSTAAAPGYGLSPNPAALTDPGQNILFGAQYIAARGRALGVTDFSDPAAVRRVLRAYSGADTAQGDKAYDAKVLSQLGPDYRAAVVEAQSKQVAALEGGLQRVAELERQIRWIKEEAAAPDAIARRELQIQRGAEEAARSFPPEQQARIIEIEKARMRAEDEAAAKARLDALEKALDAERDRLKIAGMTAEQREIELEVMRRIRAEEEAGRKVSDEERRKIRDAVTERFRTARLADEMEEEADRFKKVWDRAANGIGLSLETAVRSAMMRGRINAEDILKGLVSDITVSIMRAYIVSPLVKGLSGLIGAHGLAFDAQGARMFASGGVVDHPTTFMFANGAGLMGEAGAEAILPLKRGSDGRLGVAAENGSAGGGVTVVVNDMRQSPDAEPIETREGTGPDGQRMIEVLVRDEVRKQMASGALDKDLRSNFGVNRRLTRR